MEKFGSYRDPRRPQRSAESTRAQRTGQAAEEAAVKFLEREGLTLLARNYRRRTGELDIVLRAPQAVVIVEVRSRSSDRFGSAAASVGLRKRQRILRTSAQFLQRRKDLAALPVRFDVLIVHAPLSVKPRLEWIQHAF